MKLSYSTLGCPNWSWDDILSVAKDMGYQGVEIRGVLNELYAPAIPEFGHKVLERTLSQLKRLDLSIPCLASQCEIYKPNDESMIKDTKAYCDTAASLNTPYIRVLGDLAPESSRGIDEAAVLDNAQRIGEYAQAKGVCILIESNGYFAKTERLAKLLQRVNSPAVAALWDVHHPFRFFGEPPKETFENLKDYVRHVHLKDSLQTDATIKYVVSGAGDVPIKACVDLLQSSGYLGFYCLEWVRRWDLSLEEPGIAFAQFAEYMRKL